MEGTEEDPPGEAARRLIRRHSGENREKRRTHPAGTHHTGRIPREQKKPELTRRSSGRLTPPLSLSLGGSAYIRTQRLTRRSSGRLTPPLSLPLGGSAYIRTQRLTRRSSGRLTPPLSLSLAQAEDANDAEDAKKKSLS